jgi:radical SAM protein with 4Fe4S-binding SPASM domain
MNETFISSASLWDFKLWEKIQNNRAPLSFWLEVTSRCNNNCRQCYANLSEKDQAAMKKEISLEEIKKIVDEAVSMGCMGAIMTGGEPLLRKDFPDIYRYLKEKGLLITLFTNATLITEEHVDLFRRYPPWNLEVTVYGVTKETYERVTRKSGSYDAFMHGLNLLFDNGIKVRLKAVAMRSNHNELPEMARFCKEKTGEYLAFDPFLHLRLDGNRNRCEEIISERLTPQEIVALERFDPSLLRIQDKSCNKIKGSDSTPEGYNRIFWCGAGGRSFLIDSNYRFHPCPSLSRSDCIYDLRKESLFDAWYNLSPKVRDMRPSTGLQAICSRCSLLDLCSSCPSHAYIENGDLESKVDYFCEIAHERAKSRDRSQMDREWLKTTL